MIAGASASGGGVGEAVAGAMPLQPATTIAAIATSARVAWIERVMKLLGVDGSVALRRRPEQRVPAMTATCQTPASIEPTHGAPTTTDRRSAGGPARRQSPREETHGRDRDRDRPHRHLRLRPDIRPRRVRD